MKICASIDVRLDEMEQDLMLKFEIEMCITEIMNIVGNSGAELETRGPMVLQTLT